VSSTYTCQDPLLVRVLELDTELELKCEAPENINLKIEPYNFRKQCFTSYLSSEVENRNVTHRAAKSVEVDLTGGEIPEKENVHEVKC
jgi:hypothetical protein